MFELRVPRPVTLTLSLRAQCEWNLTFTRVYISERRNVAFSNPKRFWLIEHLSERINHCHTFFHIHSRFSLINATLTMMNILVSEIAEMIAQHEMIVYFNELCLHWNFPILNPPALEMIFMHPSVVFWNNKFEIHMINWVFAILNLKLD